MAKVEALKTELQSSHEAWDTKWNEENWAKQCAEKQVCVCMCIYIRRWMDGWMDR